MKALSFSQPWLWAVLRAGKHVENRTWQPPIEMIGQRFALHAAKSFDKEVKYIAPDGRMVSPIGYLLALGIDPAGAVFQQSAIVGMATLDRVVTEVKSLTADQRRWFFGPVGWLLSGVCTFIEPIPATGKLGLWSLTDEQRVAVGTRQLREVA